MSSRLRLSENVSASLSVSLNPDRSVVIETRSPLGASMLLLVGLFVVAVKAGALLLALTDTDTLLKEAVSLPRRSRIGPKPMPPWRARDLSYPTVTDVALDGTALASVSVTLLPVTRALLTVHRRLNDSPGSFTRTEKAGAPGTDPGSSGSSKFRRSRLGFAVTRRAFERDGPVLSSVPFTRIFMAKALDCHAPGLAMFWNRELSAMLQPDFPPESSASLPVVSTTPPPATVTQYSVLGFSVVPAGAVNVRLPKAYAAGWFRVATTVGVVLPGSPVTTCTVVEEPGAVVTNAISTLLR